MTEIAYYVTYIGVVIAFVYVIITLLKKREGESSEIKKIALDMIPTGVKIITDIASGIIKKIDKDPDNDSPLDLIMKYATIATAAMEQKYKVIKKELKEAGGDLSKLNDSIKREAFDVVNKFAQADGKELTAEQIATIEDVIEASLLMFLKKDD